MNAKTLIEVFTREEEEKSIYDKLQALDMYCATAVEIEGITVSDPEGKSDTYWGVVDGLFQKRIWNYFHGRGSLSFLMTPIIEVEKWVDDTLAIMKDFAKRIEDKTMSDGLEGNRNYSGVAAEPLDLLGNNTLQKQIGPQVDSLIEKIKVMVIGNDEDCVRASEFLKNIKGLIRDVNAAFSDDVVAAKAVKKAAEENLRMVNAKVSVYTDKLEAAEKSVKTSLSEYQVVVEARRKKATEEAEALAKKISAETENNMLNAAIESGNEAILDGPKPIVVVQPVVVEAPKVAGVSYRKRWRGRIIDANHLPRYVLMPDLSAIQAISDQYKEKAECPGVEFYCETTVASR